LKGERSLRGFEKGSEGKSYGNSKKQMTVKKKNTEPAPNTSRQVHVVCLEGEDPQIAAARMIIGPHITNANAAARFAKGQFGELLPIAPLVTALTESAKRVNSNDMKDVEATLISQATALNVMFGELSCRAAGNMGQYLETSERYLRMALKAQNQCRMTLETLSNIKNPPVIYAKQANIANGPQQVNNGGMTSRAHADENENQPSKVLEEGNEQRMDTAAKSEAGSSNPQLETVAAGDRAKNN
jgi:hypothetical protein